MMSCGSFIVMRRESVSGNTYIHVMYFSCIYLTPYYMHAFRFNIMLVKISLQNSWILLCQTPLGGYAIHVNCTEISVVSPVHMLSCHAGLVSRSTGSYAQSQLHYYMECKHRYKGQQVHLHRDNRFFCF